MKKLMLIALTAILTLSGSMLMAQPPQDGGGRGERPSTEEIVKQLKKQLDLSDEQCAQITELEANRKMPERGDRDAMKAMMEEQTAQMKKILTDKQFKKWEKLQSSQRPQGQGGPRQ